MIEMRLWSLLALVPAVAFADASMPDKPAARGKAPSMIEYAKSQDGKITATTYEAGMPLYLFVDGTPVRVVGPRPERHYVTELVAKAGAYAPVDFVQLTPFVFAVGAHQVRVGFSYDFKIHVRGDGDGELLLDPAGQAYLSQTGGNVSAALVEHVAPVPLVRISSRPEACSEYWEVYVSVVDGVPREALALYGLADPPTMSTPSVKFARDGTAVVTLRTEEDEKHVRTKRTRYRFDGRIYVEVSKRAAAQSK